MCKVRLILQFPIQTYTEYRTVGYTSPSSGLKWFRLKINKNKNLADNSKKLHEFLSDSSSFRHPSKQKIQATFAKSSSESFLYCASYKARIE